MTTARVFTGSNLYSMEYADLKSLLKGVFNFLSPEEWEYDKIFFQLETGEKPSISTLALHYCFAKGRISEDVLIDEMFKPENIWVGCDF
jgi:hypothetical protein